jgi:hypothetical protein
VTQMLASAFAKLFHNMTMNKKGKNLLKVPILSASGPHSSHRKTF